MTGKQRLLIFALAVFLVLLTLPRFNRNSFIVKRDLNDAAYYIAYVEYFRGETPSADLKPAHNWRPTIPFIASFLPFKPMTAINMVNILSLLASFYLLYKIFHLLCAEFIPMVIGLALFTFSFPTFYYSTIGYVDAGAVLICALSLYFLLRKKWLLLLPLLPLAALTKESTFIILPAAFVYLYFTEGVTKAFFKSIIYGLMFFAAFFLVRKFAPHTDVNYKPELWPISGSTFQVNLFRANTYLSFLLTALPAAALIAITIKNKTAEFKNKALIYSCFTACLCSLALYVGAFFKASVDGRVIWAAYPYLITATVYLLHKSFFEKNHAIVNS